MYVLKVYVPLSLAKKEYAPPSWHPSFLDLLPDPEVTEKKSYGVNHCPGKTREKGIHHRSGKKGIHHRCLEVSFGLLFRRSLRPPTAFKNFLRRGCTQSEFQVIKFLFLQ